MAEGQSVSAPVQAVGDGCGAPAGGAPVKDAGNQAIIEGTVSRDGAPVRAGYARLLNSGGDFVLRCRSGTMAGSVSSLREATGPYECWRRGTSARSAR